ncbi:hypothetical protein M5K25_020919 [Dendrobium thyrsiflorum]|uniref:Uncharacterized protein n=1 Tax=Dendrobium thyrsiflorum TaxID=117978 RepID=A0ABD0UBB7_DENTH
MAGRKRAKHTELSTDVEGEEEEDILELISAPVPLCQHSQFDQLVKHFDRWETRFESYITKQQQHHAYDMDRFEEFVGQQQQHIARFDDYVAQQ